MKTLRSSYARSALVPVMAVSVLCACVTWKHQEITPGRVVAETEPVRVRLTMLNGDKIRIVDPMISDGQIVGHPARGRFAVRSDTLRVPVDSVAKMQVQEINEAGVVFGLVLGSALVGGVVGFSQIWGR